jgi:hypothetical protein
VTLARYTVERYRCFVQPTIVELRPITLLFGRNAAGKSALARVLPLLAASARSEDGAPLALGSPEARGASYKEIASRLSERNALGFSLAWDDREGTVRRIELQLREMPEQNRHIVEHLVADVDGRELKLRYEPTHTSDRYEVTWAGKTTTRPLRFAGIRPCVEPGIPRNLEAALVQVRSRLSTFASSVRWLTAVRAPIPRRRPAMPGTRIGPAGEAVEQILLKDWQRDRRLIKCINRSYRVMFQHELQIEETAEGAAVVLVPIEGAPVFTALADTGEGASQALPVFVLGALAETGQFDPSPLLVLEQPEMHLHPAAEHELASFLCRVAKVNDARLLVETHSENLLLFVQLALAKGDLAPEDVAVYFVRPLDPGWGSVADRIELDAFGRPKGWPPGVFSEDVEVARELFLTQRRRASAS